MNGPREFDDRLDAAKAQVERVGGFRGNGPEERGVVACAEALIAIAEDVRAIRAALDSEDSDAEPDERTRRSSD